MADLLVWVGDVMGVEIGTIGTTDVTLGLVALFGIGLTIAFRFFRSVRR